eukprot:augustus_masked-scaffold_13-processed-gene-2.6-mRNA-1 protein AED:1.00 eAED:1.00 QI:0/-1/0/0/-1/1/1/0/1047
MDDGSEKTIVIKPATEVDEERQEFEEIFAFSEESERADVDNPHTGVTKHMIDPELDEREGDLEVNEEVLVLDELEERVIAEDYEVKDTTSLPSDARYSLRTKATVFSVLGESDDEDAAEVVHHRLLKQQGRAEQLFQVSEPTKAEITRFIEKNHLFDEITNLRYKLYKSTFGAIFQSKKYPSDFSELGPGVNSYFHFLTFFGYMFAFFGVLSVPSMFFNISCGKTLRSEDGSSILTATTLGNLFQPEDAINVSTVYDCTFREYNFQVSRVVVQEYNIFCDLVVATVFLGMTYVLSSIFEKNEDDWIHQNPNIESFTLEVTNLPVDTTFEGLRDHFNEILRFVESHSRIDRKANIHLEDNQLGSVFDVQLVTATRMELILAIEHAKLSKKVDQLESKVAVSHKMLAEGKIKLKTVDSLKRKHEKAKNKLKQFWSSEKARMIEVAEDQGPDRVPIVVKSYVTFDNMLAKHEAYSIYNRRYQCSWCNGVQNPLLVYSDKLLRVQIPAPPSVLKWENMEETTNARRTRSCISSLLVLMVLSLAVTFLYIVGRAEDSNLFGFLDGVQSDVIEEAECSLFNFTDELKLELCNASKVDIKQDTNSSCVEYIYCDCTERLAEGDSSIISDDECQVFFLDSIYNNAFSFASAVLVTLFNVVLEGVLLASVSFEKDEDRTKEERKLLIRFFFAMYINTAVVTYLQSFDLESVFGFTLPIIGSGDFSDFVNEWYGEVGSDLILIGFGQILGPHIGSVGFYLYNLLRRRLKTPISQKDVEDLYLGPEFILSFRYAQIVLTIAFCLTYSAGIPLLYLITAFCCFGTFWVDKYLMVFHCRKPINYSNELVIWICGLLKYLIILHLFLSMFFFSTPEIFPAELGGISFSYVSESPLFDELQNVTEGETTEVVTRLTSGPILLITLFFILFMTFQILYQFETFFNHINKYTSRLYIYIRRKVSRYIFKETEERLVAELEKIEQFKRERMLTKLDLREINGVSSYHILANPKYRNSLRLKKGALQSSQMLVGKQTELHSTLDVLPLLLKDKKDRVQRFVFSNAG